MTEWDGQGLPPGAVARIERARNDRIRGSLLSVGGQAAAATVGLDPVGEVMGCIVSHIGFQGWGGCGIGYAMAGGMLNNGMYGAAPTVTSGGGFGGFAPYVDALYRGWDTAMRRMLLEAQALGADGVIGVRRTQESLDGEGNQEFVARGTAVRVRSATRPAAIFTTDQPGDEVARLMVAGWMPVGALVGLSLSIRHDDYTTRMSARGWNNTEVRGYTELVTHARADARQQFERRAAALGADSAVVSDMKLHVWAREAGENHTDHLASASVVGTAVARFHAGIDAPTNTLLVLPLRGRTT